MGVKGSAAIRARQREVTGRVERLIAQANTRGSIGSGRKEEIRSAVRAGRVALRTRERVLADLDSATAEVGAALNRLVEAGLTHAEACEALGLSVGVGRRLLHKAKQPQERATTRSSTTSPAELVDPAPAPKPESNATRGGRSKGTD
jgi:DNA-directed RNA polymerase specialized sigma24 family protein